MDKADNSMLAEETLRIKRRKLLAGLAALGVTAYVAPELVCVNRAEAAGFSRSRPSRRSRPSGLYSVSRRSRPSRPRRQEAGFPGGFADPARR